MQGKTTVDLPNIQSDAIILEGQQDECGERQQETAIIHEV